MKIVIDIPEDMYNRIQDDVYSTYDGTDCLKAVRNGTPFDDAKYHLEHGEVIVAKELWKDAEKALRVIEDIKTEINQICEDIGYQRIHKDDVFKIIDKHIGERSEE